jgi:hypothetical protein
VDDLASTWAALIQPNPARALDGATVAADLGQALAGELDVAPAAGLAAWLEALDRVAWDVVLHAAERSIWALSAERRDDALRAVAVALGTFPFAGRSQATEAQRSRRALVTDRSDAAELAFVTAAHDVEPAARWMVLLDGIPLLTGERREDALREALDDAFEFPDGLHVGQAVAAVVVRDEAGLLDQALARARSTWGDGESRGTLLAELGSMLTLPRVGRVLDEVETLESEWQRSEIIEEVQGRLAGRGHAVEVPAAAGTLTAVIHRWARIARLQGDPRRADEIAGAIVAFVATVTALYARTAAAVTIAR